MSEPINQVMHHLNNAQAEINKAREELTRLRITISSYEMRLDDLYFAVTESSLFNGNCQNNLHAVEMVCNYLKNHNGDIGELKY